MVEVRLVHESTTEHTHSKSMNVMLLPAFPNMRSGGDKTESALPAQV